MDLLERVDEQSIVPDELPEHADSLCDNKANTGEDQQSLLNSDSTEDMASWFASDEAAFWMSL